LDYWEHVDLRVHKCWDHFIESTGARNVRYFSKRAIRSYTGVRYGADDYLVFGPETRGLPDELLEANEPYCYRIPMMGSGVRSLNLSNAVSIVLYEALRQLGKT
jgi:tRNA (cytidine/uridine-2'-O-)-methyltransferase